MRDDFPNCLEDIRRQTPASFVRQVEVRTALLIQAGHERLAGTLVPGSGYEFRHLSFQEYLAAWAMVNGYEPQFRSSRQLVTLIKELTERFLTRRVETQASANIWAEVIRLCIADCGHEDVDPSLQAALGEADNPLRVLLAGLCLADEPKNVSPDVATKILRGVVENSTWPFGDRGASETLERLGASRWRRKAT